MQRGWLAVGAVAVTVVLTVSGIWLGRMGLSSTTGHQTGQVVLDQRGMALEVVLAAVLREHNATAADARTALDQLDAQRGATDSVITLSVLPTTVS